ncbi:hypothetical protein [Carboxylicivirga sp. M1479]|uniref:hypothetical protein n=1 Tax=Carboxylicivirga sp. M1479 TaxID=2594476 RepID=UPI00117858F5|nr:hypothetical protein [Carboxylicivirga sp. M1479]TRX71568.1 hypothetical protein FNN09_06235 [Carboxylicivirga sp. M1479]
MKKVFLFAAAAALVFSACQKEDRVSDTKTTDVQFNVVDGLTETGLKSGDLNRGSIPVTVSEMSILAESVHPDVSADFTIVDDASGMAAPMLSDVWYGTNVFSATTKATTIATPSYGDHKVFFGDMIYPSGVYKEVAPGLVAFTDVRPGGSWSPTVMAEQLRTNVVPYVEFSGESSPIVINDAYAVSPTQIPIHMSTTFGQLIVTFEFEKPSLIDNYHARLFYQEPVDMNNVGVDYDYLKIRNNWDRFFTSNENLGTVYWSNADATVGKCLPIAVEIYSYEGGNYVPVKWIMLDTDYTKIEAGTSKWVRVVVNDEALMTNVDMFNFTWDGWSNKNVDLEITD